jgi:hypothetical protein
MKMCVVREDNQSLLRFFDCDETELPKDTPNFLRMLKRGEITLAFSTDDKKPTKKQKRTLERIKRDLIEVCSSDLSVSINWGAMKRIYEHQYDNYEHKQIKSERGMGKSSVGWT